MVLLDPTAGRTHNLTRGETIRVNPGDGERPLELAIGTQEYVENKRQEVLPDDVRLTSYPNPMQGQGTIEFALPKEQKVTLRVYDILGRNVATLAAGTKEAGRHTVRISSEQLSSGVYFGRLQAGEQTHTLKITVVK